MIGDPDHVTNDMEAIRQRLQRDRDRLGLPPARDCFLHIDCDLEDRLANGAGRPPPVHCNDGTCTDHT